MILAVVILTLTVSDPWTGVKLEEVEREYRGATPDVCLRGSLQAAHRIVSFWRARGHPYASANINCRYKRGRDA